MSAATRAVKGSKTTYSGPGDTLVSEPWCVSLRAGSFDFTLVLLRVGQSEKAAERVAELRQVDDIYRWYQYRDSYEQDVIIMGDFINCLLKLSM